MAFWWHVTVASSRYCRVRRLQDLHGRAALPMRYADG